MLQIEVVLIAVSGANFNTGVVLFQSQLHQLFRATGDKEHKPFGKHGKAMHYKIKEIFPGVVLCLVQCVNNN